MDLGGFIYISHEIEKQSKSIFFARMCDFWSQWIQWIYIEFYRYPQAIAWNYMNFNRYPWANVWNYMNFNRYPHIGRGPTCRWQSSSLKPLRLHSMHFTRAFLLIHWRRCKLLASMWVSVFLICWSSVSHLLKLALIVLLKLTLIVGWSWHWLFCQYAYDNPTGNCKASM